MTPLYRKQFLARAHSIGQHHDGITGTNSQFVNDDFIYEYYKSRNEWQLAADRVMAEHFDVSLAGFRCDLAQNATICLISEQFTGNDFSMLDIIFGVL